MAGDDASSATRRLDDQPDGPHDQTDGWTMIMRIIGESDYRMAQKLLDPDL
jgi:hypothetical protein